MNKSLLAICLAGVILVGCYSSIITPGLTKNEEVGRIERQTRVLEEYQVASIQNIFGFIAFTYYIVVIIQIISILIAVVRFSDKIFWLTGFSMQLQLLFLLGSFKLKRPGLLYSIVNYAGFQSSTFFGNGDLHLDPPAFIRQHYLDHGYSMLKAMSVSPFIMNHRLAPMLIYLVCAIMSSLPKVGHIFFRIRIATCLNYMVHFVFFGVTTLGAVSQLGNKATASHTWYQVIFAVVILLGVGFDLTWLVCSRTNRLKEMKNKRKISFDFTKLELLRHSNSILFTLIFSCDIPYAFIMSFIFGVFGEVRGANFFLSGLIVICHMVLLMYLLIQQATNDDRLYSFSIMLRIVSQFCFSLMILILGTYQFTDEPFTEAKSKSAAEAFFLFWIVFVLIQFAIIVARFIVVEPRDIKEHFRPRNYDRRTRLPVVLILLT